MGELIKFQLENEKNKATFVNIFIPPHCNWNTLQDLIQFRFNLNNQEKISEIIIMDTHTKKQTGKILANDKNINISFTSYCIVKLQPNTTITHSNSHSNSNSNLNTLASTVTTQLPISPITKQPLPSSPGPKSPTSNSNKILKSIEPSPIVAAPSSPKVVVTPLVAVKPPSFDEDFEEVDSGNTLLHDACALGHLQYVTTLVQCGQDIEVCNNMRQTPFLLACLHGHLDVVKFLAASGANVFAEDETWSSALHFAAQSGNVELIDWLITEANQDRTIKNRNGQTALDVAKLYQQVEAIRYFSPRSVISASAAPITLSAPTPASKLENSTIQHKVESDNEIDNDNGNGDDNDNNHNYNNDNDIEEDEDQEDEEEKVMIQTKPPSDLLLHNNNMNQSIPPLPTTIRASNESEASFLHACLQGDKRTITQFLENNGDVNCCNENGSQGIHFVASSGNLSLLLLLLQYGVDVDSLNKNNCTALHFACQSCHFEMIQWLITEGNSNVFIENINGMTPIHILCGTSKGYEALHWFIESHPLYFNEFIQQNQLTTYPHVKSLLTGKVTLLHVACTATANPKILSCLLDHGFDFTLLDDKSQNALHIACNETNLEAVKLICSNAPDIRQLINIPVVTENITPIFYACLSGSYPIVKYLMKYHPDLNIRNIRGNSCVHAACQSGNLKIVKYLIKKGCSIHVINNNGFWPLDFAIKTESKELIAYLHEIHALNSTRYHELVHLCLSNDVNGLKQWIQQGYDLITCVSLLGYDNNKTYNETMIPISILHEICYRGLYDIFKLISKTSQCNLTITDKLNRTPLHLLCMSQSQSALQILDLMISFGIFLDPIDSLGFTPFFYSCQYGNITLAQKLINYGCNIYHTGGVQDPLTTALHLATAYGHLDLVKWLTESGLNIYSLNENENTPIDISKFEGHQEIYQWFVHTGVLIQENRLETTLLPQIVWTLDNNHFNFASSVIKEIIPLIQNDDIQHFISSIDGSNLLHYSCGSGNLELTIQLISKHCDLLAFNNLGYTPFHVACIKGHETIVEYLRTTCNIKVTIKDQMGNSGFHYACIYNHLNLVKYYCHLGFINMINNSSSHGLHYACQYGHIDIIQLLLEYNVTLDGLNNEQMTPLHVACYYQWDDIIILLIKTNKYNLELEDMNHMTISHLITMIGYQPLIDWMKTVTMTMTMRSGGGGGGQQQQQQGYPTYEPTQYFKKRGKKLHLFNEEHRSESESEDGNLNSHHSKSDYEETAMTNLNNGSNSIFPVSLFFCISDTSTSPRHTSLSNNMTTNLNKKQNELKSSQHDVSYKSHGSHHGGHNGDHDIDEGVSIHSRSSRASSYDPPPHPFPHPSHSHSHSHSHPSQGPAYQSTDHDDYLTIHKSLFESIENHNYELFLKIFNENSQTIDLNYCNPLTLNNIFHITAKNNNLDVLKYLLENPPKASSSSSSSATYRGINSKNINSLTPLHIACEEQFNDLILYLITVCQADMTLSNNKLQTSLSLLIMKKNIIVLTEIEKLLREEVDLNLDLTHLSSTQQSYLHLAVLSKSYDLIVLVFSIFQLSSTLSSSGSGSGSGSASHRSSKPHHNRQYDYTEVMNLIDCDGKSPLHYACQSCSYNVITFLLSHAADISLTDNHHCTPVYYAVIAGNLKIVQLLLEKYNNLYCLNDNGDSLLHVACHHGRLVIAKWLVTKGLDMKLKNNDGNTPIDMSEQSENKGVIEWSKTFI